MLQTAKRDWDAEDYASANNRTYYCIFHTMQVAFDGEDFKNRSAMIAGLIHNNIGAVTPYELRHTFVSVMKTLPAGEVKELVGHSMNMDTFGTYAHYLDGNDERTAQSVSTAFCVV